MIKNERKVFGNTYLKYHLFLFCPVHIYNNYLYFKNMYCGKNALSVCSRNLKTKVY